jgi:hypothetical protein
MSKEPNGGEIRFRISDLALRRIINPAKSKDLSEVDPKRIIEACGIIPDFFASACCRLTSELDDLELSGFPNEVEISLDCVAEAMDGEYGYGGFGQYPFHGSLDADGTYRSPEGDDDPPLPPLARYAFPRGDAPRFECFVYQYAITALREIATGETRIARFD